MMNMMDMMNGAMWMMMLFWILIIGLVIYGLFLFISKALKRNDATSEEDSALRILKERFARGDIDEEEYERKKEVLLRK